MIRIITLIGFILFSLVTHAQQVIITSIVDGTLSGGKPRVMELYVNGTADLATYRVERVGSTQKIQLSGIYTNEFVYIIINSSEEEFNNMFGNSGDFSNRILSNSTNWNGDDAYQLTDEGVVVDQVGEMGTVNYQDSYLYRKDNTGLDAAWIATNWNIPGNDILDDLNAEEQSVLIPLGTYQTTPIAASITVSAQTAPEEPATMGYFRLILNQEPSSDINVTYQLSGTAQKGTDYNDNMSGTVVISSGTTSVDIPISVIDDLLIDPNETITMSLESASNNFDVTDASATLVISDDEPATFVPIYDIQGSSDTPNRLDEEVNTRGIVTATYFEDGQMGGFFIQDPSGDSNAQTSDGIYVFCGSNLCKTVAVGDLVSVDARVREYFGLTELSGVSDLSIISNDNSLPTPVDIVLDGSAKNLESVEGMLVRFPETLYVTDVYEAGTKGEITLSSDAPLVQPTQLIDPNDTPATGVNATGMANVAAIQQQMTANTNNRIRLDDGDNGQEFTALPFFFSNEGTVRIGSSVSQLTGAMHYSSGEYKIEPLLGNHPLQSQTFTHIPRPAVPTLDNADVIVAAFNVLNYFNGDGQGGGFPTRRGAQTLEELQRQEAKIVAALSMMNADVVGLNEMEKDGTGTHSALRQLVDRLNDQLGAGTYAFIDDSHLTHTSDIIRNAIIYRPDKVTPIGAAMVSANTNRVYSRKPVAQRFRINSDQTEFVYIINHLKAKSCNNASDADLDQNDGQGCFNDRRKKQATQLATFIQSFGEEVPIISMGDYNAYYQEDPIDILRAAGLQSLNLAEDMSYVFSGQLGALDFALVNTAFEQLVTTATSWNINAQEPPSFDYNDSNPASFYQVDPYRSSDHNPMMVGIRTTAALPVNNWDISLTAQQRTTQLTWQIDRPIAGHYEIQWSKDGEQWQSIAQQPTDATPHPQLHTFTHLHPDWGINYYQIQLVDELGRQIQSPIRQIVHQPRVQAHEIAVYPNPAKEQLQLILPAVFDATQPATVQIWNMQGKQLRAISHTVGTIINIGTLPAGVYQIRVQQLGEYRTANFVKR